MSLYVVTGRGGSRWRPRAPSRTARIVCPCTRCASWRSRRRRHTAVPGGQQTHTRRRLYGRGAHDVGSGVMARAPSRARRSREPRTSETFWKDMLVSKMSDANGGRDWASGVQMWCAARTGGAQPLLRDRGPRRKPLGRRALEEIVPPGFKIRRHSASSSSGAYCWPSSWAIATRLRLPCDTTNSRGHRCLRDDVVDRARDQLPQPGAFDAAVSENEPDGWSATPSDRCPAARDSWRASRPVPAGTSRTVRRRCT